MSVDYKKRWRVFSKYKRLIKLSLVGAFISLTLLVIMLGAVLYYDFTGTEPGKEIVYFLVIPLCLISICLIPLVIWVMRGYFGYLEVIAKKNQKRMRKS